MVFEQSFKRLHKNLLLFIFPLVFDLLSLILGVAMVGFYGEQMISSRMILEMGLPSVSHLSNIPVIANTMDFLNVFDNVPMGTFLVIVLMIICGAFLQGGYIDYLSVAAQDTDYHTGQFFKASKRNWIQFIILEIIILLGKIAMTSFLAIFFGIIGVFASLCFFLTLRIIFIYLEFTMVIDRTGVAGAFNKSRHYLIKSMKISLVLVLMMYSITSALSFLLHYFWSLTSIIVMMVVYAYVMTVIQLIFMDTLLKAKAGHAFTREKSRKLS